MSENHDRSTPPNRRQFLSALGAGSAVALAPSLALAHPSVVAGASPIRPHTAPSGGTFVLPPLPYAYDALEAAIDTLTMVIHHDRHHNSYVTNLNAALEPYPALRELDATTLISDLDAIPESIRTTVRNNAGGHVNHSIFWAIMGPGGGGAPGGALGAAIDATFGSFDQFKAAFNDAAARRFGSGWAWLVIDGNGTLSIMSTPNQDSPYMMGLMPLLGNDVWEHAYYLRYQNRRAEYLAAWWNVVNWDAVAQRYAGARG
jgi:superoxide dismutase, Fe-Mn family